YHRHDGLVPRLFGGLLLRAAFLAILAIVGALALKTFVVDQPAVVVLGTVAAGAFAVYFAGLALMRAPERTVVTEMIGAMRRRRR
ncbi:MAG: murein biosynthesis integral membrane protein MurJ, partial [Kocuria sp.]|nr:murein biosynthesis integral membrane protein MurJ [Kocuria sp.]